uniref:CCDC66 domain-containing protein n=1 Tax=Petromyzon marinus TaxID=7757 RepID=S4RUF9_PETMA
QKAIASQMEERRRHKLLEDERRRYEEEEAERKITEERHRLNRQFLEEQAKLRQKEENRTRKTENLYQSVQRAQEEALRDKQEQRMRELARKGHDVSNLRRSREGQWLNIVYVAVEEGTVRQRDGHSRSTLRVHEPESSMKDTGVQTVELQYIGMQTDNAETKPAWNMTTKPVVGCVNPAGSVTITFTVFFVGFLELQSITCDEAASLQKSKMVDALLVMVACNDYRNISRAVQDHNEHLSCEPEKTRWFSLPSRGGATRASDKYPKALKKRELEREARKQRRQEQLLAMVNRKTPGRPRTSRRPRGHCRHSRTRRNSRQGMCRKSIDPMLLNTVKIRLDSPAVPALRHRLQQQQQQKEEEAGAGGDHAERGAGHAPEAAFVPYLRSDDVLYLDPDAPMSRPPTNESQYRYGRGYLEQRRHSSEQSRDPLLNPELLKSKDRQKAILEGLSQLRQGLLMKQREVETYLSSPMLAEDVSQFPMQS